MIETTTALVLAVFVGLCIGVAMAGVTVMIEEWLGREDE